MHKKCKTSMFFQHYFLFFPSLAASYLKLFSRHFNLSQPYIKVMCPLLMDHGSVHTLVCPAPPFDRMQKLRGAQSAKVKPVTSSNNVTFGSCCCARGRRWQLFTKLTHNQVIFFPNPEQLHWVCELRCPTRPCSWPDLYPDLRTYMC